MRCLPGGFSYGDDVAAGRILATQIRHHLQETLQQFKADGKLVLGICNGFQILIKSGLLLADQADGTPATLTWNDSGKFEDRWVDLAACSLERGNGTLTGFDGKLYLNYNKDVQSRWEGDVPGNIAKGDANWPTVLE